MKLLNNLLMASVFAVALVGFLPCLNAEVINRTTEVTTTTSTDRTTVGSDAAEQKNPSSTSGVMGIGPIKVTGVPEKVNTTTTTKTYTNTTNTDSSMIRGQVLSVDRANDQITLVDLVTGNHRIINLSDDYSLKNLHQGDIVRVNYSTDSSVVSITKE